MERLDPGIMIFPRMIYLFYIYIFKERGSSLIIDDPSSLAANLPQSTAQMGKVGTWDIIIDLITPTSSSVCATHHAGRYTCAIRVTNALESIDIRRKQRRSIYIRTYVREIKKRIT